MTRRGAARQSAPRRTEPIRTCIGCRQRGRRTDLVRLVARAGTLECDPARRLHGRGAYLHARRTCVQAFTRRGGFVRSLRCVIAKDERETVVARLPEVQG